MLKALLAGTDDVHLYSVLLKQGAGRSSEILTEYESVDQLKGVSQQHAIDPSAYERANYVQLFFAGWGAEVIVIGSETVKVFYLIRPRKLVQICFGVLKHQKNYQPQMG